MELAVEEQRLVMFPGLQQLEAAQRKQDLAGRKSTAPSDSWSPTSLPYKTHDRDDSATEDSEEDSDSDAEPPSETAVSASRPNAAYGPSGSAASIQASAAHTDAAVGLDAEVDGLQVGMEEEVGFRYSGPEPTLYGDWAHKGRVTDF